MAHRITSLQIDNASTVAYLVKEGGMQSTVLCNLAAVILNYTEKRHITLRPSYLPGVLNTEADALYRQTKTAEWMLTYPSARPISRTTGYTTADLYFSTDRQDHAALGTDALHHEWEIYYVFPPPMLIPLVLARIHRCYATMILLVNPWWPRAPRLSKLINLSVRLPYRLP